MFNSKIVLFVMTQIFSVLIQFLVFLQLYTPNHYVIDGCATFYRQNKFTEIKNYEVNINQFFRYTTDKCDFIFVLSL